MTKNHLIRKGPCYRCPIACGRHNKWKGGEGAGPEYEAIWCFGSDCGRNYVKVSMPLGCMTR